ncbi:pitrilysin family protein [Catenulispora subtropica]|uniref:Pitrilysin family protein n=1 Tax=Catenulispora subtropica TaxID=450798 RepID=A0ABN2TA73_9ACTN
MRRLPALGPFAPLPVPDHVDTALPGGLAVLAVRRAGEPLVEIRLRIPFGGAAPAAGRLLARTLFAGTASWPAERIAASARAVGGTLDADADADRLQVSGRALAAGLSSLLGTLGGVLTEASYPPGEVALARDRLLDQLRVAGRRPDQLAGAALARRIYPGHPYGSRFADPADLGAVTPADLRALHAAFVRPGGSTLILVGDLDPVAAVQTAGRRLAAWTGVSAGRTPPPVPPLNPGTLLVLDRPGSSRSSLRMAFPAVARGHPDNAALRLANLVFGGYSGSRWTANLREDKGYAYGPRSTVQDLPAGSHLIASAEVAAEHTGPALAETLYELGRMACLPPRRSEVDRARDYTLGSLAVLGMSTHRDLADLAAGLVGAGLPLTYLAEYVERLAAVTVQDVHAAATTYLAPSGAVAVLLGDAARVGRSVAALTPVAIADSRERDFSEYP